MIEGMIEKNWQLCLELLPFGDDYLLHPEDYVRTFDVTINGKLRHLKTYKADEKGWNLRRLHTAFSKYVSGRYVHARSSYAYVKKKGILDFVNRHLENDCFLKTDIHAYFDSIKEDDMVMRVRKLRMPGMDRDVIARLTRACFNEGTLPLGFTSSPVLSDLYLVSLDRKYQKNTDVTYTRYADDFLISASGPDALEKLSLFQTELREDLKALGLELNKKKTYYRQFLKPGDAIHVLGVNIVKTEGAKNRVTISDRYVRETSKALCAWLDKEPAVKTSEELSQICGKIGFIKYCSPDSFQKLEKMIRIKSGYSGALTMNALQESAGID